MMIHDTQCTKDATPGDTARNNGFVGVGLRSLAIRTLVAVTVAFLWFAPYICTFFEERSRCFARWQLYNALVLIGAPILLALIFVVLSELIRRLGRPSWNRIFNHLFVMAFGGGLLTVFLYQVNQLGVLSINPAGTLVYTSWMLLAAVVGYSFAKPHSKLVLRSCQFCLILSPMAAIIIGQLLAQRTYPPRMDSLADVPRQSPTGVVNNVSFASNATCQPTRPVYMFIFDEWSYERTFENDMPAPKFVHMNEIANNAIVFTDTYSPDTKTETSLPGVLLQTELKPVTSYPELGFKRDGQFVSCDAFDSIFSCVKDQGYHTLMLGFGFPAHLWLGEQVDTCREYRFWAEGRNAFEDMVMNCMTATTEMNGPWFEAILKTYGAHVYYPYYYELHYKLERDVTQILTCWPRNTFAVMHYMLPHKPFIFRGDGSARGPDRNMYENSPENYLAHLACLDRTIGQFIDLMKKAHTFDDALIIMTSDHSWRADPTRRFDPASPPKTHVPLFVKMPGQNQALTITDRYELCKLRPLIEFALQQKGGDLQGAQQVVEAAMSKWQCQKSGHASTSHMKKLCYHSPNTRSTVSYVGTHARIH